MYGGRLEMKKISRKTACLIITALLVVIGIGTYFCKNTYAKNTTMIPKSLEIKKGKSMKIVHIWQHWLTTKCQFVIINEKV